ASASGEGRARRLRRHPSSGRAATGRAPLRWRRGVRMPAATRARLARDLGRLGLAAGDCVMVHAALRAVGPVVSGADAIIAAIRDAVGTAGTLLVYTDWEADLWDLEDDPDDLSLVVMPARPEVRDHALPFDPAASRAL